MLPPSLMALFSSEDHYVVVGVNEISIKTYQDANKVPIGGLFR